MSLRIAVIGVGHLGRHHARLLVGLDEVELVAAVDTNRARADEVAASCGTSPVYDARDVMGKVDAVTIAVPTESHSAIARPLLEAGVAALVEKPIARSVAEADGLVAAAKAGGALLAVGHTERHNPAVAVARSLLRDPRFIEVHRLAAFQERSLDVDVVFDVMIHDLDVVLSLVPAEVESLEAVGIPVLTPRVDIANVRIRFGNGCIANLTASRISRDTVRKIRFFQPMAYVSIDYAAQKVEMWQLVKRDGARACIEGGDVPVTAAEPLRCELVDFVEAVRSGRPALVTGADGRRALALAEQITERMAEAEQR